MSQEYKEINDLFRSSFEGFRIEPSKSAWSNISRKLWLWKFFRFSVSTFNVYYVAGILTATIVGGKLMSDKIPQTGSEISSVKNSVSTHSLSQGKTAVTEKNPNSETIQNTITAKIGISNEKSVKTGNIKEQVKGNLHYNNSENPDQSTSNKINAGNIIENGSKVMNNIETASNEDDSFFNDLSGNTGNKDVQISIPGKLSGNIAKSSVEQDQTETETEKEQDVIIYDTIRIHVFDTIYTYDTMTFVPSGKSKDKPVWSVEAFVSPVITSGGFAAKSDEFSNDLRRLKNATSSGSGFIAGAEGGIQYRHWRFNLGFTYAKFSTNYNDTITTKTTDTISYPHVTPGGYYSTDTTGHQWEYDPIHHFYVYAPVITHTWHDTSVTTIVHQTYTSTNTKYYNNLNTYTYLEVPFSVGYEFRYERFSIVPRVGGVAGILLNAKGRTLSFNDNVAIIDLDKNKLPFLKLNWSWMLAVELNYRFNDRFSLVAEPFYRQNLNSIYGNENPFRQSLNSAGVRFGIKYDF